VRSWIQNHDLEVSVSSLPDLDPPRHLKVTGVAPAYGYERCEDPGCLVALDGTTSSCGRLACPACGCGGTNLTTLSLIGGAQGTRIRCTCGYSWLREAVRTGGEPQLSGAPR
jgi:hypothetical protein